MARHVSDLGWVDFHMDFTLILPSCSAHSAYLTSAQAESCRQWNNQNQSQPNQVIDVMGHLVQIWQKIWTINCVISHLELSIGVSSHNQAFAFSHLWMVFVMVSIRNWLHCELCWTSSGPREAAVGRKWRICSSNRLVLWLYNLCNCSLLQLNEITNDFCLIAKLPDSEGSWHQ